MLTLAIDTATKVCTVALCREQELLAEYTINMGLTHSEGLLPQLEQLLARTGVQKQDIGLLAVSMGPGSFTGLRIGLATAEAMAYAWQCCLHGVDTLKALAYNIQLEGMVLSPVLDAQKGNFYQALYQWQEGKLVELAPVAVVNGQEALAHRPAGHACPAFGRERALGEKIARRPARLAQGSAAGAAHAQSQQRSLGGAGRV